MNDGRNWIKDAAFLIKHLPGISNPLTLPIDEFNAYLFEIYDRLDREANTGGPIDHRSFVEAEMNKHANSR